MLDPIFAVLYVSFLISKETEMFFFSHWLQLVASDRLIDTNLGQGFTTNIISLNSDKQWFGQ